MKQVHRHLHDDTICMLHHYVLLSLIRDERLLLNAMVLQKPLKCLENKLATVVQPKVLILYSDCVSMCALNSLNLLKQIFFSTSMHRTTPLSINP